MVLSEQSFTAALRCHQAGHVRQAATLYRDVLRDEPDHSGALHLLGVACQQQGDAREAAACIRRAIAIDGSKAVYHNNLGVAFRGQGRLAEAVASLRQALTIKGRYPDALSNLATVPRSYQHRLSPSAPAGRSDFGLPASGHLYICPGRLGKLHPESDPLSAAVPRAEYEQFSEGPIARARGTLGLCPERIGSGQSPNLPGREE